MVEFKKLGDVGEVCMCKRIMKDQTSDSGEIPFFKIGTFGSTADSYISRELFDDYKKKYSYPKKGEILISASGTIGRSVIFDGKDAYFQDSNIVWISNDESAVLNKYLYYYYQIIDWKVDGGTIKRLYNYNLKNATILVPSLSEQNRIVGILDTFTASIENLKQQIAERRKQYEYYRDQLLDLEGKEDVEMKRLLDVLEQPITDGPHETPKFYEDGVPFISADAIVKNKIDFSRKRGYISVEYDNLCRKKYAPKLLDIYLVKSGSTTGKVAIVKTEERFNIWSPLAAIRVNKSNSPLFIYFMLQTRQVQEQVKLKSSQGSQPNLSMRVLEKFVIPVPSLDEQQRIASILDTFEASISNLEAQLKEREKQYEYYRNKLLSFE